MKRFRKLLLPLFSVLLVLALVFTAACSSCKSKGDNDPETPPEEEQPGDSVTYTLQSISLDTSAAKTDFVIGDAFTSAGLKVTASFSGSDGTSKTEDVSSSAYVNSTAFDGEKQGVYEITVSYSSGLVTASATYVVTVNFEKAGVDVILTEDVLDGITLNATKDEGDFTLDAEHTSVTIDPEQIEVRIPNDKGEVDYTSDPVAATEYTVAVYKTGEAEPLESYDDLGGGVYQIWATLNPEEGDEYEVSNFALVFVSDGITNFAFASGTQTQEAGDDTISATWTFTATYASGDSKTVSKSTLGADETLTSDIDTMTAGQNKTANVTYTYKTQRGATATATTTVTYSITAATTTQVYELNYNPDGSSTSISTTSGPITVTGTVRSPSTRANGTNFSDNLSTTDYGHRFQLGGSADFVKISVPAGTTKITVWFYNGSGASTARVKSDLVLCSSDSTDSSAIIDHAYSIRPAELGNGETLMPASFAVQSDTAKDYYLKRNGSTNSPTVVRLLVQTVVPPTGEANPSVATATFHDGGETLKQQVINYAGGTPAVNQITGYTPAKAGNTFDGWATTNGGTDYVTLPTTIDTDKDYYAHWTEQGVTGIKAEKTTKEYILVNNNVEIKTDDITVTSSTDSELSSEWVKSYLLYTDSGMSELYDSDGKLTVANAALATEATKTFYLKVTATKGGDHYDAEAIAITVKQPTEADIELSPSSISGQLSAAVDGEYNIDEHIANVKIKVGNVELAATTSSGPWTISHANTTTDGTFKTGDNIIATKAADYTVTYTLSKEGVTSITKTLTVTVSDYSATPTYQNVTLKADTLDLATSALESPVNWDSDGKVVLLNGCKVTTSSKTVDTESIGKRVQTSGGATTSQKSVKIDLTSYTGNVKIRVAYCLGSGDTRQLVLLTSEKSTTSDPYWKDTQATNSDSSTVFYAETTVECGAGKIYYLGGTNGMNIYKLQLIFNED